MKAPRAVSLLAASILSVAAFAAEPPASSQQAAAPAAIPVAASSETLPPESPGPGATPAALPVYSVGAIEAPLAPAAPAKLEFSEIWAYLIHGEESFLDPSQPITDIGYFGAGLGVSGNLVRVPPRAKLPNFKGRVHLVVEEGSNFALTHFCLSPEYPLRDALVADLAASAKDYDGVQIDFEAVSPRDYENFYAFLGLLKGAIGVKSLSVALPAYVKEPREGFSYEKVAKIVDRIVVMAYDEHWSSSEPGPVASMDWCRKVSAFAVSKIGPDKLVMGLPFYGRAWADKSLSRAYKYSSLAKIIDEKGIWDIQRKDDIPYLEYEETVNVKVYFDDSASTISRLGMYRSASVRNVAFWRLGQEDSAVWASLAVGAEAASQGETPSPSSPDYSRPPYLLP